MSLRTQTLAGFALLACALAPAREALLTDGWKFTKGDPPGAERRVFDDLAWETVRVPHDWAIAGPFDPEADGGSGKLPWWGVGWYRKWLMLDRSEAGSRVYLDFDGVMAAPSVYVNGRLAGQWDYGYTPFRVDITEHVRFGRANTLAIQVDTRKMRTRWYPGAGIYRKVRLTVSPPLHLARHGTCVRTPEVADSEATVVVTNELENHLSGKQACEVVVHLLDPDGEAIAHETFQAEAPGERITTAEHRFRVAEPQRWDVDTPRLYTAVTQLVVGGRVVERRETPFGLRTFRFDADEGFWLNGRRVELHGANLHHDLGPLGAAFNRAAAERQLRLLQGMGVNAIRTSHNPPAEEVLDLCDRMGLLVWDELFDKWDGTAGRVDGEPAFEPYFAQHAASFIRRDRNHPSIVVWSVGNEIVNQPDDPEGKSRERIAHARREFLRHDPTRPVGLGCFIPSTAASDTLADLDVAGWNYQRRYALFRERFPETPIVYSESASAVSTRGHYELPLPGVKCDYSPTKQVSAYELTAAPWADIAEVEFERMRNDRFVAGEFVWTGFDYLGEPTPFAKEARSSYFGVFDLVGLPKDRYYLYRSHWLPDEPTVHLAPHWNWPDRVGQNVPVMLYTNGDSAELFLNSRSLGVRRKGHAPAPPEDLAADAEVVASSHEPDSAPARALGETEGCWEAASSEAEPWVEVDLGEPTDLRAVVLHFPREAKLYGYRLLIPDGQGGWRELGKHTETMLPLWGGVNEAIHPVDARTRRLRVAFGYCLDGAKPSLDRLAVYAAPYESTYYAPTYDYRLRWNDVVYEPGELRAVAYRDGEPIGESVVRTAGRPARLALEADRTELKADGEDLAYVTVTAVDADGVPCPLADDELTFAITGAGYSAGADAGNPLDHDPLQDDRVRLFYGKAIILVRSDGGPAGPIRLRVEAAGLPAAELELETAR